MIGSAILLSNFIEGNMKQFIIPVYQRNYDWLIDNCEQLFNDLVKLSKQHKQTHFLVRLLLVMIQMNKTALILLMGSSV